MNTTAMEFTASAIGKRIILLSSKYHLEISKRLEESALNHFIRQGGDNKLLKIVHVSGAWETISATAYLAKSHNNADGIVVLGCVINGETDHSNWINNGVSNGIAMISAKSKIPIGFGILTCNSLEEALERSGGKIGDKGAETMGSVLFSLKHLDDFTPFKI